jgi:hypothetical protein
MKYYATLDTSIYGVPYAEGAEVNTSDWVRTQLLQYLGLGLISPSISGGTGLGGLPGDDGGPTGPIPPTPSMPLLSAAPHGYVVVWDGMDAFGSSVKPANWSRVEVHSSITTGFGYSATTLRGTFESTRGGSMVIVAGLEYELGLSDTYEVLFVARDVMDVPSLPSSRATIRVGQIAPLDVPDFMLTVRKFNNLRHQLY